MALKNTYIGKEIKKLQAMALTNTYNTVRLLDETETPVTSHKVARLEWDNSSLKLYLSTDIDFAVAASTQIRYIELREGGVTIYRKPVVVNIGASNTIYTLTKLDVIL